MSAVGTHHDDGDHVTRRKTFALSIRRAACFLTLMLMSASCTDRHAPTPVVVPPPSPTVSSSSAGADAAPKTPGKHAPFAIAFVVDQLAGWIAEERWPLLPETGGFARLRREGTWVKKLRYPYAVTDTAPGHASLHSGKLPAESGIWGNELPDVSGPFNGRVSFLRDAKVKVVAPDGVRESLAGSSASRLRVDNVADRLRAAHPEALIVSISLKDRGAILPGGHKPTHAIWFESHLNTFVTSTAFEPTFPKWAIPLSDEAAIKKTRLVPWTVGDPDWLAKHVKTKDDASGEGDLAGFGTTFPHTIKESQSFRASPASDDVIFSLALAALNAEYDPAKPTLLLLSMSALDVIGHVFGPDSWEAWDHLLKLDTALGRFLDAIDHQIGDDVSVILSADHGSSSMPETVLERRPKSCTVAASPVIFDSIDRAVCATGERLSPTDISKELKAEALAVLGAGDWILGVADPYIFLGADGKAANAATRAKVDAVVKTVTDRHRRYLDNVFDTRALERDCPSVLAKAAGVPLRALGREENVQTLVCRSWAPNLGAGDWYMVPSRGSYFDGEITPKKGGSHGTPYLHDRTVPLLVRAKGLEAGSVRPDPTDFTAYSELLMSFFALNGEREHAGIDILRATTAAPTR